MIFNMDYSDRCIKKKSRESKILMDDYGQEKIRKVRLSGSSDNRYLSELIRNWNDKYYRSSASHTIFGCLPLKIRPNDFKFW
ncbi:hypothetical protein CEXT_714511 [Caerostris extrusa]|uniref:Ycf15 n=1 Tax=Caerostris extrusa TaxID=172846 RepID=A0AAV4PMI2_CAEEX|nr:hypothetical protein CEXT_714511 [Caerostris extrusa]